MIDVLKAFYTIHYNFAALSLLLFLLIIFLVTKKNYKWMLIFLAIFVVFNVFLFKRTDNKTWTIVLDPPKTDNPYDYAEGKKLSFSVKKNWTIKDPEKDTVYHWCWVDQNWEEFSQMDLVAKIWGENSSKKMIKASETHGTGADE